MTPKPTVVLVHGLWMNSLFMLFIAKRLKTFGYYTLLFNYSSLFETPVEAAEHLDQRLKAISPEATVHFVCHSLGGILIRHLFAIFPKQKPGRIVTLGTPHHTSYAAKKLRKWKWIVGKSAYQGLLGDIPAWRSEHQLAVIAGTRRLGLGMLLGLPGPSDGVVSIEETKLDSMAAHLCLPVSHTGLLTSAEVVRETAHFLQHGVFSNQ